MKPFRYYPRVGSYNIITDVWLCGPKDKSPDSERFDGSYPTGFLTNIKNTFKEVYPKRRDHILHVCAGRVPKEEGTTLDISPRFDPDILCDAQDMAEVNDNAFDWVMADWPYNEDAARRYYNTEMLSKGKVMKEMARVCKVGGIVAALDESITTRGPKCLKRIALIGITTNPNKQLRVFNVYRKIEQYVKR